MLDLLKASDEFIKNSTEENWYTYIMACQVLDNAELHNDTRYDTQSSPTFTVEPYSAHGFINVRDVNVRSVPTTISVTRLGVLQNNIPVTITGKVKTDGVLSDWFQIKYNNEYAYIASQFVTLDFPELTI